MISTISHAFFWANMLIVSPNQSVHISNTEAELWFSEKSAFNVKSINGGVVFESIKAGKYFSSGLNINNQKLTEILSLETQDYKALKNCKNYSELKWENKSFVFPTINEEIKSCNFKNIFYKNNTETLKESLIQLEQKLKNYGIRIHSSYWNKNKRVLAVLGDKEFHKQTTQEILKDYYSHFQIEYIKTSSPGNTLNFEVTLFEFSRRKAEQIGIKWPQNFQVSNLNGINTYNVPIGAPSNTVQIAADFGVQAGVGKVLAQPLLRAQPGVEAIFQSGGEIPIKNHSSFHSQTIWKNYGLTLKLTPEESIKPGTPEVGVKFSLELSEPDPSTAINGIPGMLKRNLQSEFNLRTDETTLLSSLLNLKKGKNSNGVSFFSELPLLGLFFKSQNFDENNTELYIAIKASWEEVPVKNYKKRELHAYRN